MPFDFALLDGEKLLGIIEVDDDEHRHNHDNCVRRQIARERDIIKNKYCQDNKIKLFRMPYTIYGCDFKNYNWYYNYIDSQLREFIKSLK
jgi:hypothetical protein